MKGVLKMKPKWLLAGLAASLLLSVPSIAHKIKTEQSAPVVEFSVDYLSLLELSQQTENPNASLDAMLLELKQSDISTLTLPNNTFASLESRGLVSVLTGAELQPFYYLAKDQTEFDADLTYVLTLDSTKDSLIYNLLSSRFPASEVTRHHLNGNSFLGINLPIATVLNASIPFLESDKAFLSQPPYGFSLIAKIDNQWDGQEQLLIDQLYQWNPNILSKIFFADAGVLGFPTNHKTFIPALPNVPFAYKEYFDGEARQLGIGELAVERNYNLVRLHAVPNTMFTSSLEEPKVLSDRLILGAKERNIRTFHMQFPTTAEDRTPEMLFNESLEMVKTAQQALAEDGFTFGISHTFTSLEDGAVAFSRIMAFVAGILLVTLLVVSHAPKWGWHTLTGISVLAASSVIIGNIAWHLTSLLVSIAIPLLSATWLLKRTKQSEGFSWTHTLCLFLGMSLVTLIGAFLVVGMHSGISYSLYLIQFRGVTIAHLVPPFLLVGLMVWHLHHLSKDSAAQLLNQPIRIYQALLVGLIGFIGYYYLSRTGNSGVLIPFEAEFRAWMQDLLGVRPRTKEFLIAHPLLMVIIFYWHRLRFIKWLLPVAIIGQISIVNTFTHLHTPVAVSLLRSLYGIGIGALIGLLIIWLTEAIYRYWTKRTLVKPKKESLT